MQIAQPIDQHASLVCLIQDNNMLPTSLAVLLAKTHVPTILTVFMAETNDGLCDRT